MALIDLHTHSSISLDGDTHPSRLVEMAHKAGVTHFALTDHNRVDGVADAMRTGAALGLTIIPAIEIDCRFREANLHILGYGIDYENKRYREFWQTMAANKAANNEKKIEAVRALGFHLDRDEVMALARDGVLGSVNIADAVLKDPRNKDNPALLPFRPGGEKSANPLVEFCWTYVTRGRPAYVDDGAIGLPEAVDLVVSTGGVPVLAHPGSSIGKYVDYLPDILAAGVEGVEVYCGYHSPEEAERWKERAAAAGVFITCGSDYHGEAKPAIQVGVHGGDAAEPGILQTVTERFMS